MKPPKCVAWYPDRLSWQIDVSQSASLKQSESRGVLGLHAFFEERRGDGGADEARVGFR